MFARSLLLVAVLAMSCAPTQPVKRAPPPPDPILTTEQLAYEAEREINSAESELTSLEPDRAIEHLDAAHRVLINAKIDNYPDAELLRSRHRELTDRVPLVREEVRKRDLAAAVKEARSKIDGNLATLKDAMDDLKKKRPDEADFKAAEESFKNTVAALDEASKLEPEDRDYAKYALETRKQLSAHKKLAGERRLQVSVDVTREQIAEHSKELDGAIKDLRPKDVRKEDFDRARAAADNVQKTIESANPLIVKDLAFAKQVSASKKKLEGQRDQIAKREHEVAVERQRIALQEANKTLNEAVNRIRGKDAVDADFAEADAAVGGVEKLLTDGGPLAAKDSKYGTWAVSVKAKVDESKQRIAARRIEVAVAKQKAEIETARIALGEALFRLNGTAPAEGEFEAARNSVTAVEKTLDASETLTPKDRDFSRYVLDVRKGLQGARAKIEQRKFEVELGQQRAKVAEALAAVKQSTARMLEPGDFEQAEKSVVDLEKTIDGGESFAAKDRVYSKFALDARKSASDARRRIRERQEEVAVDNQKAKVTTALEAMKEAVDPLSGFSPGEDQFNAATAAIAATNQVIAEGAELERKVGRYQAWAAEPKAKVRAATERVEKRRTQIAVRERKLSIENGLATLGGQVGAAKQKSATGDQVKEAEASLVTLKDEIAKGTELEVKDLDYRKFASWAKSKALNLAGEVENAKHTVAFREGPVASMTEGLEVSRSAKGLEPEEEKKAYSTALDHFRNCQKNGAAILAEYPGLAAKPFAVAGRATKAKDLMTKCGDAARTTESRLGTIEATLAFYTGPAKELENAKSLLADADVASDPNQKRKLYDDALRAFEKCLEQGKTLEYRQPELKTKKFELNGKKVTLALVVAACQKGAKTTRETMARK